MSTQRKAQIERVTGETNIKVSLNLDSQEGVSIQSGIGFFDHMLDLFAFHAGISLQVVADGDLHVDGHHTVEDIAIGLGMAFANALGDKQGIARYASAYVPLNEALGRCVVDYCGRGTLRIGAEFSRGTVGAFDTELVEEFFRSFSDAAALTMHLDLLRGGNTHHEIEVLFKAFGRATGEAIRPHPYRSGIVSTKGAL